MSLGAQDILDYLRDQQFVDIDGLDAVSPLFSSGIVDSFSLIELMTFIEDRSGVRFEPADVTIENIDTVECILALVSRLQGSSGSELS